MSVSTLNPSTGTPSTSTSNGGKLSFLVLDSNAFIRGHGFDLYHKADRIVTVTEVLEEIRDAKAQDLLSRLPFTLEILTPSPEACREVADFAMKTGDFRSLSKTDLRLIALTYTLYLQEYGGQAPKRMKILSDLARAQQEKKKLTTSSISMGLKQNTEQQGSTTSVDFPPPPEEPETIIGNENEEAEKAKEEEDDGVIAGEDVQVSEGEDDESEGEGEEDEDDYDSEEDDEEDDEEEEERMVRAATEGVQGMEIKEEDFPSLGGGEGEMSSTSSANAHVPVTVSAAPNKMCWADMAKQPKQPPRPKPISATTPAVVATKPVTASKVIAKKTVEGESEKDLSMEGFVTVTSSKGQTPPPPSAAGTGTERSLLSRQMQNENISRQMQAEDDGSGWISASNLNDVNPFEVFATANAAKKNKSDVKKVEEESSKPGQGQEQGKEFTMTEEEREKAEKKRKKKEAQRAKKQLLKEQEQTSASAVTASVSASTVTEQVGKKEEGVAEHKETETETKPKSTKENEPKTGKEKPKKESKKEKSKKTGPSEKDNKDQEAEDNETNLDGSIKVACFTTDFAMQNVLLQLGLKVLATNGYFIRSARQWVLRCLGCHTIHTKDLHRMFCSQCGLHHLTRVAASIDAKTGKLKLHLKKNYHVDTSGMKYSLPSPGKQGRFQGEILLREDQLLAGIWKQKTVKINRDVKSAFGEDVTSEVGLHLNKLESEVFVGWGRSNPNARKGRERRGKRRTTKY